MAASTLRRLSPSIWALGFVSMFMDISSEMIHALLPVYMVTVLAAPVITVGIIEGVAEATASFTKLFSGALSDWWGARKPLAVLGYGLAAITKPVFPLVGSIGALFAARFVDRIGKGIRDAPRDALVTDLTPADMRGAAFGLRQALDTVGAFLGPAIAMTLMLLTSGNFTLVFWLAVPPAFISLGLIIFAVKEPACTPVMKCGFPLNRETLAVMPRAFWGVTAMAAMFTLARFSEAFLILKGTSAGLPASLAPAVLIVMNIVYAAGAYPAGVLADRPGGRRRGLAISLICLIAADVVLAQAQDMALFALGIALWGAHMALSQGLLSALVADHAPAHLRGTAFGIFNLVSGASLLAASVIAGTLWDWAGPAATFQAGAAFAILALAGLLWRKP